MSVTTAGVEIAPHLHAAGMRNYARRYWLFAIPAAMVVVAVILGPWLFTLVMSVNAWKVSGASTSSAWPTTSKMFSDQRFLWAVARTLYFTTASVVLPVLLGVWAAVCFASNFKLRGIARTIFILPMMATPVAIALVWTMMFHPQLGVLNYLLSLVGLPPSAWVYNSSTRHPDTGHGGDLAVDAAGDADRARRHRQPADGSL